MKQAGIVYGMQNPTHSWVKIGCVEDPSVDRLRKRWKDLSPLGDPLLVRRAVRVEDAYESEKMMHNIFETWRLKGTERFYLKAGQFCSAIHLLAKGKGDRDIADFITKEANREVRKHRRLDIYEEQMWGQYKLVIPSADSCREDLADQSGVIDSLASADDQGRRKFTRPRPRLTLAELGLRGGNVLNHARDDSVTAIVVDPDERVVKFEGENMHIREATRIMQDRAGLVVYKFRPYSYWKFEGKLLKDLYNEACLSKGILPYNQDDNEDE